MRKLLISLASVVVSMVTEILLRRLSKAEEADAAEAAAIQAAVVLGMAAVENVQLPAYLAPFRGMLFNQPMMGQLAKFLFDQAEDQVKQLLDALDAEKLAALKSDLA